MNYVTVASQLNDEVLRADYPKMRGSLFDVAVRIAAYVSKALTENPTAGNQRQFCLSFLTLRKALPISIIKDLTIVGPKLADFMGVVQEVSGLAVVHQNDALWFFDMRARPHSKGAFTSRSFHEHYNAITPETRIMQFVDEDEDQSEEA